VAHIVEYQCILLQSGAFRGILWCAIC